MRDEEEVGKIHTNTHTQTHEQKKNGDRDNDPRNHRLADTGEANVR